MKNFIIKELASFNFIGTNSCLDAFHNMADKLRCGRCSMVVLGVFPQIMQELMKDSGIPAPDLYQKIMKNPRLRGKLSPEDMASVQTLLTDGYSKIDVTLVYKIAKYFKMYIPPPTRGWGSNPQQHEIEIGDDVERIRIARNHFSHKYNASVSEEEEIEFFDMFIEVGRRVDEHLNKAKDSGHEWTIKNYRVMPLDEELAEGYIAALKEIEKLKEVCKMKHGEKVVHILCGKSMEEVIQRMQGFGADTTQPVRFIIEGIEDTEQQTEILNRMKDDINDNSANSINFIKATRECVAVYVEIKRRVVQDRGIFYDTVLTFTRLIFKMWKPNFKMHQKVAVILTSEEDDKDPYVASPKAVEKTNSSGTRIAKKALVLNVEIKKDVFRSQESFQHNITEFVRGILKRTNGREMSGPKKLNLVVQPGEEVTKNENEQEDSEDFDFSSDFAVDESIESEQATTKSPLPSMEINSSDLTVFRSSIKKDVDNNERDLTMAQCHITSPTYEKFRNIPPQFREMKRNEDSKLKKPWKISFGFRRLIELKEEEPWFILQTFDKRKMSLMDAVNDKEMSQNREILLMLLRCFAKCCHSEIWSEQMTDIFDILQYSEFLTDSLVQFVHRLPTASVIEKQNYFQQAIKDIIDILIRPRSHMQLLDAQIRPIVNALYKNIHILESDICDEEMRHRIEEFKALNLNSSLAMLKNDRKSSSPTGEKGKKAVSDETPSRKTDSKFGSPTDTWRLKLGFRRLRSLVESKPEDIVEAFGSNQKDLKEALCDEKIKDNTHMVAYFLRCMAKCAEYESSIPTRAAIFEIVEESLFMEKHVMPFVTKIAIATHESRKIPIKQSLEDILVICDAFNTLLPKAVTSVHKILLDMDTAINTIKAIQIESEYLDDNMWHTYNSLLNRTESTSPVK